MQLLSSIIFFCVYGVTGFDLVVELQDVLNVAGNRWKQSFVLGIHNWYMNISLASEPIDSLTHASPTTNSRFLFGSGTKPVTAACILKLVDARILNVNDTIVTYINPLLEKIALRNQYTQSIASLEELYGDVVSNLTIYQLATMTFGVNDFDASIEQWDEHIDYARQLAYATPDYYFTPVDILNITLFPYINGTHVGYSSTNFALLGMLLASVHGYDSWETFNLGDYLPGDFDLTFLAGETPSDNPLVIAGFDTTQINNNKSAINTGSVKSDATGWTASSMEGPVSEVARLYYDIYGPTDFLTPESRLLFTDFHPPSDDFPSPYGFGTMNLTDIAGVEAHGHFGATYGYMSGMAYVPEWETSFVAATNRESKLRAEVFDVICRMINVFKDYMDGRTQRRYCTFIPKGNFGYCGCT